MLRKQPKCLLSKRLMCSVGPKYPVSERKEFVEKKQSKLEF